MVPHAIVVDFAVALLVTSFACDVLSTIVEERELGIVAWWTLLFGTVAAAFAVLSGLAAARLAPDDPEVLTAVTWHRNLGLGTMACFAVCLAWRLPHRGALPERHRQLYWLLVSAGTGVLLVTSYFGGILVFAHGVGVQAS